MSITVEKRSRRIDSAQNEKCKWPRSENAVRSTSNQENANPQTKMTYLQPAQVGGNEHERRGKVGSLTHQ